MDRKKKKKQRRKKKKKQRRKKVKEKEKEKEKEYADDIFSLDCFLYSEYIGFSHPKRLGSAGYCLCYLPRLLGMPFHLLGVL